MAASLLGELALQAVDLARARAWITSRELALGSAQTPMNTAVWPLKFTAAS